jgi:hypothetical protein
MKTEQLLKVYKAVKYAAQQSKLPKPVRNHYNAAMFG